jgi:hypothetical protein
MSTTHMSPAAVHQLLWMLGGLLVVCTLVTAWAVRKFIVRLREGKAELEKMRLEARVMQLGQLPNQE